MTLTTGIDMIEIDRIETLLKDKPFLSRFFSEAEQSQYRGQGGRASYIAGSFCAKEAFSKAIGTGLSGFALHEVEVLRDELGKPRLSFSGNAKALVEQRRLSFDVSISHTKEYAVAVVIAYCV